MRRVFRNRHDGLERQIRDSVPEADDAFVSSLSRHVAGSAPRPRRSRAVFASAMIVVVLGVFASFGGLGYAAENAKSVATAAKEAVAPKTSAEDQYGSTGAVVPPSETTTVKVAGATAASAPAQAKGTLPFTGLSLVGALVLGTALLAVGVVMRRREQRK